MVFVIAVNSLLPVNDLQKSRVRETSSLSTDADSRTDKMLEKLRNFF